MKTSLLVLALLVTLAAGCAAPAATPAPTATSAEPRTIRLPMGYIPSVQYAPFYVAVDKGYFAEAGLDVQFDYSFETSGVQLVGANELPFAVVSGEQVLLARAQGLPVVYVMAWFQKFPVSIIAPAERNLLSPADLAGRKVGTPTLDGANFVGLRAMLASAGVPAESVTVEAIGFNQVPALTSGQVRAAVVYSNNEPIRLAAQGLKLTSLAVSDYVDLAANGILSSEKVIAQEPELVRGFVGALLHGLQDTLADPDEAFEISRKYVENLEDEAVERQVLAASIELWHADRLGYSDPVAWTNMQLALLETGLLGRAVELDKAFTNEFIP